MCRYYTTEMWKLVLLVLVACTTVHGQYFGGYQCDGGRDVIVHLFEWKWSDVQAWCPTLADMGYCAVQVSPAHEHIVLGSNDPPYPWWQRYQPVSYTMTSRSGDEAAFQSMVSACNAAGVKIYVDALINHMTGGGSGTGSAGTFWDAGDVGGQNYPGVPYGENDFNGRDMCSTQSMEIENYQDVDQVRNCRLVGLRDLRLSTDYVRDQTRGYMQKLVNWGVAGFRMDACKHMWPGDQAAVFAGLTGSPFIFQEVIDQGGEPITAGEYVGMGRVTEFKYGLKLGEVFKKQNGQMLAYLNNFGEAWGFLNGLDAVVFIDNHDNQRGHGGGGSILTHKEPKLYKMATAFMLAWDYGYPRVMSSYSFPDGAGDQGPPADGNGNTNDVECFNGDWVCEHAWRQIYNMVKFHNTVVGEPVTNWWDNTFHAISFSRGNKGFIVINNEDYTIDQAFQTGLPGGEYCDVISCEGNSPPCGGSECVGSINVDGGGWANIQVTADDNPVRAYHV